MIHLQNTSSPAGSLVVRQKCAQAKELCALSLTWFRMRNHNLNLLPRTRRANPILDARGIFLYKTPNEAHQLLEDRVLLKLDWSKENKAKPLRKTVAFVESKENSPLLEKMEALTTRIDSQFKEIR
ncbi:hypothetical protein Tco_0428808 [Tanacetum coccineum]